MAPQPREEWETIKEIFLGSFTFVSNKVKESDELLIRVLKIETEKGKKGTRKATSSMPEKKTQRPTRNGGR